MAAAKEGASGWKSNLFAGLVGLTLGVGGMLLTNGYFVRSYLLAHPEVIPEAMERLRTRQTSAAVDSNRAALETPFHSAWAGAADGDVVLVYFSDYACGYCRLSNPDIARLLREDPRLKVVWREYPVLGPDSEQAAVASMAAARAGRFRAFHEALFATARPTPAAIEAANQAVGLGPAQVTEEFRQEIRRNEALARSIGASGTPVFVVGGKMFDGAVGYEALKAAIADARART